MTAVNVTTWNVHHRRSDAAINRDLHHLFHDRDTHVVGLNEMGGHQRALQIPHVGHFYQDTRPGEGGNAIAWHTHIFEFLDGGNHQATRSTYVGGRGSGPTIIPPKYITWVKLLHRETRRELIVAVNHFPATIEQHGQPNPYTAKRLKLNRKQWQANVDFVRRHAGRIVLLLGDFNWNAHRDTGLYRWSPRAVTRRINMTSTYLTLGYPKLGTDKDRYIDYIVYPRHRDTIRAKAHDIYDINRDNDHRVLTARFDLAPVRQP